MEGFTLKGWGRVVAPICNSPRMSGTVIWITGLSGAGKTTLAGLLLARMRCTSRPVLGLDGDILRTVFPIEGGYTADKRVKLAHSYARLCREVSLQGIDVVCATISMFHAVRRWNRENIQNYVEIYLEVPLAVLRMRDAKGLYGAYARGEESSLVGVDVEAELPENPDFVIQNLGDTSPEKAVDMIWERFLADRAVSPSTAKK